MGHLSTLTDRLRFSRLGLAIQRRLKYLRRRLAARRFASLSGRCPICDRETSFYAIDSNPRDGLVCVNCGSVPRHRAVALALHELSVRLSQLSVHESSPSLCTHIFFRTRCGDYVGSYFFQNALNGARVGDFLCVDLLDQPFGEGRFDLVVTQDVFEHVRDPLSAFTEIRRTLRAGGVHVFTVPRCVHAPTKWRVRWVDGNAEMLEPEEFHRDPISRRGSLVVTDWGVDLEALLYQLGQRCRRMVIRSLDHGVVYPIEVFAASSLTDAGATVPSRRDRTWRRR